MFLSEFNAHAIQLKNKNLGINYVASVVHYYYYNY